MAATKNSRSADNLKTLKHIQEGPQSEKATHTPSSANYIEKNTQKSSANKLGHKKNWTEQQSATRDRQTSGKKNGTENRHQRQMRSKKAKKTEARRSWMRAKRILRTA